MAQYALAKYVQSQIGDYPDRPYVNDKPAGDPEKEKPRVVLNIDGQATLAQTTDLVKGLNLEADDTDPVHADLEVTDYSCSDADNEHSCTDDATNPVVQLKVDDSMPKTADVSSGTGTGTGTGKCDCNESGCSADSPPCCANGTCKGPPDMPACDCNESGCSADSPACCANGSC